MSSSGWLYRAGRKGVAGVTDKDRDQTPDEVTGETTSAFPSADFVNEPDAVPTVGADSAVSGVEALPPGSALIVVKRGPNAGSRFLLDQPVTSVGRHPGSDIFLDDVTVSRRHAEFRWEKGRIPRHRRRFPQRHLRQPGGGTATRCRSASFALTPRIRIRRGDKASRV